MTERLTIQERREHSRRLSSSIKSLRTAFRYALEQRDTEMLEEIKGYAGGRLNLNALEVNYVHNTAVDDLREAEENDG